MKTSAKQQIALTTALVNVFLLAATLTAFTVFTRYLLEKNLNTDLIIEAEEIVTQHLNIDVDRITFISGTTDLTIEQDLLTDRLSAMIVNQKGTSIGKFGAFAKTELPRSVDLSIRKRAKLACSASTYNFQKDQHIEQSIYTYLFYPILKDGICYGTIIVAGDTHTITEISRLTFTLSLIAVAFATLMNLLLGKAVASRILKPLHQLAARMQHVNLDTETPKLFSPYAKNDEISSLIETFNTMASRVSETAATQKSFIVDASHELKTPIARAVTDLDLIKLALIDNKSDPKLLLSLDQAQTDLKSIANIINMLLQATKLKQVSLNLTNNSLTALVAEVIQPLQKTYTTSKIDIQLHLKDEQIFADKQVVTMILRNCLVNAFKYNIANGSISLKTKDIGNTYTLIIKNTTAREGVSVAETESYKLGFDIIRNLCVIAKYDFSAESKDGHYTVTLSNLPKAPTSKV